MMEKIHHYKIGDKIYSYEFGNEVYLGEVVKVLDGGYHIMKDPKDNTPICWLGDACRNNHIFKK